MSELYLIAICTAGTIGSGFVKFSLEQVSTVYCLGGGSECDLSVRPVLAEILPLHPLCWYTTGDSNQATKSKTLSERKEAQGPRILQQ